MVNRSQAVSFHNCLSHTRFTSTGSPQGTVLSPVLFTLYTNDCKGTDISPVIKYSDDTAIQDLSNSDTIFTQQVEKFIFWCKENYLDLNVKKTKEMIIDFRRKPDAIPDLYINGAKVERVDEYKYLGTILDNKLTFSANTQAIYKKCQSRIYFLQKLRSLKVNAWILSNFYRCYIESVATFGFLCWLTGLKVKDKNKLERVVNVCSKVVGVRQKSLKELYEKRVVNKGRAIAGDSTHVLTLCFAMLPSGKRYRAMPCNSNRSRLSFTSKAIEYLNKNGFKGNSDSF